MKRNIDILALRSYVLAEKLGSFTKAASNLHCSPAALSFRIKKLEETLKDASEHNLQALGEARSEMERLTQDTFDAFASKK